ncbi:MAG: hypothetical protein IT328_04815 [Caldilineaceae bacterium]|nr:hypothetical protein [Caldilineaceae bacterium]
MNQRTPRQSMPNGWNWTTILRDLVATWRLLWDPSVPGLLKLALPFMALIYVLSPLDFMPLMPFDDIAIVMLAARLFVALAPRESVDRAFGGRRTSPFNQSPFEQSPFNRSNQGASRPGASPQESGEVIDTTWRIVE